MIKVNRTKFSLNISKPVEETWQIVCLPSTVRATLNDMHTCQTIAIQVNNWSAVVMLLHLARPVLPGSRIYKLTCHYLHKSNALLFSCCRLLSFIFLSLPPPSASTLFFFILLSYVPQCQTPRSIAESFSFFLSANSRDGKFRLCGSSRSRECHWPPAIVSSPDDKQKSTESRDPRQRWGSTGRRSILSPQKRDTPLASLSSRQNCRKNWGSIVSSIRIRKR